MELTKDQIMGLMFYHQQKVESMMKYNGLLDSSSLDIAQEQINHLRTLRAHYDRKCEAEAARYATS